MLTSSNQNVLFFKVDLGSHIAYISLKKTINILTNNLNPTEKAYIEVVHY